MCYSNHHHRFRDKAIQQFDALFYEKGNLRRCHYRIWYDLAHRIWGISYKSYLSALRKDVSHNPQNKSVRVQKNEKVRFGGN